MSLFPRLAAAVSGAVATFAFVLAEPPPVRLTLGPRASAFFRRMEDVAHEHGLSCSADELATATASSVEQLLSDDEEQDEELMAIAAKLEELHDRVDTIVHVHSAAIDGLTQQIGQVILGSHKGRRVADETASKPPDPAAS